jgi:hypothetical protein
MAGEYTGCGREMIYVKKMLSEELPPLSCLGRIDRLFHLAEEKPKPKSIAETAIYALANL